MFGNTGPNPMPRASHSEAEREQMRQRILAAARALFQEGGLEAVSMRAIGRRVGLTAAALYAYFPDKAELLRALWHDALHDLTVRLQRISAGEADPLAAIRALAAAYTDFAEEDPVRFRVLFLRADPTPEQTMADQPDIYAPYLLLRAQIETALRRGLFGTATDADLVAQAIWGAVHGVLTLRTDCLDFSFRPLRPLVSLVVDTMIGGLARPSNESEA